MSRTLKISLVIAAVLAVGVIGAGLFVESGFYDIGADDHHTKIVLAMIEQLRERSIAVRTRGVEVPPLEDPHPPNLAQEDTKDTQRAFWIIKHGIKMSAMPAWGKTLDDAAIWDIVSFIRKMPDMSADQYRQLSNPLDATAQQR